MDLSELGVALLASTFYLSPPIVDFQAPSLLYGGARVFPPSFSGQRGFWMHLSSPWASPPSSGSVTWPVWLTQLQAQF